MKINGDPGARPGQLTLELGTDIQQSIWRCAKENGQQEENQILTLVQLPCPTKMISLRRQVPQGSGALARPCLTQKRIHQGRAEQADLLLMTLSQYGDMMIYADRTQIMPGYPSLWTRTIHRQRGQYWQ